MTQSTRLASTSSCTERRHDRIFGRFDIIHHVTTTRSRFCVTFFVPTSVAANQSINLLSQPVLSTSHHQPVPSTCLHQPVISSVILSIPPCSPSPQSAFQPAYQPVDHIVYLVCYFACYVILIISLLLYRQD